MLEIACIKAGDKFILEKSYDDHCACTTVVGWYWFTALLCRRYDQARMVFIGGRLILPCADASSLQSWAS